MKRALYVLFSLVLIFSILSGCGEKDVENVDFDALSGQLLDSGAFTDLLCPLTKDITASLYGIDEADIENFALFCSTGATAEEIALFKAVDEAAAQRIMDAVEKRITNQITSYENYVPEEVPKLEDAIIRQNGLFIAYITADKSNKAAKILDAYM